MSNNSMLNQLTDAEKALNYYRAGMRQSPYTTNWEAPEFVPIKVSVTQVVKTDLPYSKDKINPGVHDVGHYNKWGAISVMSSEGMLIGLRPHEFDVIEWQENKYFAS